MITKENRKTIERIHSINCMRDYRNYSPLTLRGRLKYKKYRPYTLSDESLESLEMLRIVIKEKQNKEEIETVKAYLLKRKLAQ